jgi:hypothetical protein
MASKISEKKEDFNSAFLIIQNMLEAEKIERFKFTPKEQSALLFVTDLLTAHIDALQNLK